MLIFFAGHETTVNLIGNGTLALLRHPAELERLRADAERSCPSAVEELLRYDSPVQRTGRSLTEDVEVNGRHSTPGQRVNLFVGAANRDPAQFDDPDRLDITRANASQHLSFAAGIHYCVGAPLARLEAQLALSALLRFAPGCGWPRSARPGAPRSCCADCPSCRWHCHDPASHRARARRPSSPPWAATCRRSRAPRASTCSTHRGRRIIDAAGGVGGVTSIGHAVPEVVEAIARQLRTVAFVPWTQFQTEPARELADRVAGLTPAGLNNVALFNGGSEVTEGAVKLARQYWLARGRADKYLVISRWQGFHGMTLGATGLRRAHRPAADVSADDPRHAQDPAGVRLPLCRVRQRQLALRRRARADDSLVRRRERGLLHRRAGRRRDDGRGAGAARLLPAHPRDLRAARHPVHRRRGHDRALVGPDAGLPLEHWGVVPDILVAAKGVSGGYAPLAVLAASDRIVGALRDAGTPWVMGHTFSQNPVTATAGLAVLDYIQKHDLVTAAAERGAELSRALQEGGRAAHILGDVRGLGMLQGIELVRDKSTREPFPVADGMAYRLARACIEEGAAIYPGQAGADGELGDHALVTPPLTITSAQIQELAGAIDRGLTRVEATL